MYPHHAVDLLLDLGSRAQCALGGDDLPTSKPAGEHIKEVHTVLDENAAALLLIPEPMVCAETLVGGVIFEKAVKKLAQDFRFNQPPDEIEKPVITLHQIGNDEEIFLFCKPDHFIRLADIHGERFFADHMLARLQRFHGLDMMKKRRRGNIDQVNVFTRQQRVDIHRVGKTEPVGHRQCCFPMR